MVISKRAVYEVATGKCLTCTHPVHFGPCSVIKHRYKKPGWGVRRCKCSRPGNNLDYMKAAGKVEEAKKSKSNSKYSLRRLYMTRKGDLKWIQLQS